MSIISSISSRIIIAAALTLLIPLPTYAQSATSHTKPPKPDLHAGGANPSSIPNDATTEVTLPGFHLAGARVETGPQCSIVSPPIVTDNEIKMNIKGTRKVDDEEDKCDLVVHTAGGKASTWIVIELTEAQQQAQSAREKSEEQAKAEAFIAKAGKSWRLKFAGGVAETYTSTGENQDAMPHSERVEASLFGSQSPMTTPCSSSNPIACEAASSSAMKSKTENRRANAPPRDRGQRPWSANCCAQTHLPPIHDPGAA